MRSGPCCYRCRYHCCYHCCPCFDRPGQRGNPSAAKRSESTSQARPIHYIREQNTTLTMEYATDEEEGDADDGKLREPLAKRMRQWSPVRHTPPPAPPSTPASLVTRKEDIHLTGNAGIAAPSLPSSSDEPRDSQNPQMLSYEIRNAAALEQAQKMQEMATPAPTPKTTKSTTSMSASTPDDFSEWAVGDRYQLIRMLGRGSYGEVAQARDLQSANQSTTVAIKRITSAFESEVDAIRLYREIHILRRLRGHECIIQLLDVVQPPNLEDFHDLYLVFECECDRLAFCSSTLLGTLVIALHARCSTFYVLCAVPLFCCHIPCRWGFSIHFVNWCDPCVSTDSNRCRHGPIQAHHVATIPDD